MTSVCEKCGQRKQCRVYADLNGTPVYTWFCMTWTCLPDKPDKPENKNALDANPER